MVEVSLSSFFSGSDAGLGDLKTELEPPRLPNGDFAVPAKAANDDPANAEAPVVGSLAPLSLDVSKPPKGDVEDVFENALGRDVLKRTDC